MSKNNLTESDWDKLWNKIAPHLQDQTYFREFKELQALPSLLEGVHVFVDAGASFGPYTWLAHHCLEHARIIAIEANPKICSHLDKERAEILGNGNDRGNDIKIVNHPLSNTKESVVFEIDENDYSVSTLAGTKIHSETTSLMRVELETTTLDMLFPDNPPDLVKLDIEGAEWRALEGARKVLAAGKTTFIVEIHPWGDAEIRKRPSDVFKLFRSMNYTVSRLNHHWLFEPKSPSPVNRGMSFIYGVAANTPALRSLARILIGKS
jgi:FkbM family methyltransferase